LDKINVNLLILFEIHFQSLGFTLISLNKKMNVKNVIDISL